MIAKAQLTVTTTLNKGTSKTDVVDAGETKYATVGAVATFSLNFSVSLSEGQQNLQVKSLTAKFASTESPLTLNVENNATWEQNLDKINETGEKAVFTVVYTFEQYDDATKSYVTQPDITYSIESDLISVFNTPSSTSVSLTDRIYMSSDRQIEASVSGGNPNGWKYTQSGGDEISTPKLTVVCPNNLPNIILSSIIVTNAAPNGTVWYTAEYKYETYFFKDKDVHPSLSVSTNLTNNNANYKPVKVGDIHYGIEGSIVTFYSKLNKKIDTDYQRNFTAQATVSFNGMKSTVSFTGDDANVVFENLGAMDISNTLVSVTYSYEQRRSGTINEWELISNQTIEEKTENIRIFSSPTAKCSDGIEQVYYSEDRRVNVYIRGGNTDWRYIIDGQEKKVDNEGVYIPMPKNLPNTKKTNITFVNYAPDGTTVWDSEQYELNTYFFKDRAVNPGLEVKTSLNGVENQPAVKVNNINYATEHAGLNLKISYNEEYGLYHEDYLRDFKVNDISVVFNGGTNSLKFEGKTAEAEFKINYPVDEAQAKVILTYSYAQRKSGTADVWETITGNKVDSFSEIVTILPTPVYTHNLMDSVRYAGQKVSYTAGNVEGGNINGWTYHWSTNSSEKSTTFAVPSTSTPLELEVKNYAPDGKTLWYSYTDVCYITVYELPSVHSVSISNIYDADWKFQSIVKEGYINYKDDNNIAKELPAFEMLEGDETTISFECLKGMEEQWYYRVFLDGYEDKNLVSINKPYTFHADVPGTHTVHFVVSNGEAVMGEHCFRGEMTRKYIVHAKPSGGLNTVNIDLYPGMVESITPFEIDDSSNAWYYQWSDGTSGTTLTVPKDDVEVKTTRQYICDARLICEGYDRVGSSGVVNMTMWPKPKVTGLVVKLRDKTVNKVKNITYYDLSKNTSNDINIDCFANDILDISYNIEGGYSLYSNNWFFEINNQRTQIKCYNEDTKTIGYYDNSMSIVNTSTAYKDFNHTLRFINTCTSGKSPLTNWFTEDYNLHVRAWPIASIHDNANDSIGVYGYISKSWTAGDMVDVYASGLESSYLNFNVEHFGGYTDGWNYEWKNGNTVVPEYGSSWTYIPTVNNSYEDKTFSVRVSNHIGDNYSFDETITYKARIWSATSLNSDFNMKDVNRDVLLTSEMPSVRSGNTVQVYVNDISDGYVDGAIYDWTGTEVDGWKTYSNWYFAPYVDGDSRSKGVDKKSIICKRTSVGPYGRAWQDADRVRKDITIYNHPETPSSLVRKGNGTSGTMICTTNLSDEDLEEKEYYLTFGYTDALGIDHNLDRQRQLNPGEVRWSPKFDNAVINNSSNKMYVYATWLYGNDASVTSGKRFVSGSDENWDGSDYSHVTRSIIGDGSASTGIEEVGNNVSAFDDNANTRYYTIDGKPITSKVAMKRGIYIKETIENGKRNVSKFIKK